MSMPAHIWWIAWPIRWRLKSSSWLGSISLSVPLSSELSVLLKLELEADSMFESKFEVLSLSVLYQGLDIISHHAYLKNILITSGKILYTTNSFKKLKVLKIPSLNQILHDSLLRFPLSPYSCTGSQAELQVVYIRTNT